jgi:hypothetical protein
MPRDAADQGIACSHGAGRPSGSGAAGCAGFGKGATRRDAVFDGMDCVELEPRRAAVHGFTDPELETLNLDGVRYDALANDLSWNGTLVLLEHLFGE